MPVTKHRRKYLPYITLFFLFLLSVNIYATPQNPKTVIAGDSRAVGMAQTSGFTRIASLPNITNYGNGQGGVYYNSSKDCIILGIVGAGYTWLWDTSSNRLNASFKSAIRTYCGKSSECFILMGANDYYLTESSMGAKKIASYYIKTARRIRTATKCRFVTLLGTFNASGALNYLYSVYRYNACLAKLKYYQAKKVRKLNRKYYGYADTNVVASSLAYADSLHLTGSSSAKLLAYILSLADEREKAQTENSDTTAIAAEVTSGDISAQNEALPVVIQTDF